MDGLHRQKCSLGQDVTFVCSIYPGWLKVTWFHKNMEIVSSDKYVISQDLNGVQNLTITGVESADGGVVSIELGKDLKSEATLTVIGECIIYQRMLQTS